MFCDVQASRSYRVLKKIDDLENKLAFLEFKWDICVALNGNLIIRLRLSTLFLVLFRTQRYRPGMHVQTLGLLWAEFHPQRSRMSLVRFEIQILCVCNDTIRDVLLMQSYRNQSPLPWIANIHYRHPVLRVWWPLWWFDKLSHTVNGIQDCFCYYN